MLHNLSSAAVLIGALRVNNICHLFCHLLKCLRSLLNSVDLDQTSPKEKSDLDPH